MPLTRHKRILLILALVFGGVALDQATKYIAIARFTEEGPEGHLRAKPPIAFPNDWYPHDLFRFQFATNTGAFLSLGSGLSESMRFWVLTGLNAVILFAVAVFLLLRRTIALPLALALGLILSGGVGNLIDRIFRDGEVIDFMNVGIGFGSFSLRSGIFNVADLAIVAGLILLVAAEMFNASREAKAEEGAAKSDQKQ